MAEAMQLSRKAIAAIQHAIFSYHDDTDPVSLCLAHPHSLPTTATTSICDMRLLRVDSLEFTKFHDDKTPPYAIASHRWQEEEATYQDVRGKCNRHLKGYKKVEDFAKYVQEHVDTVKWLWIDTCCINQDSAAELSEAINLMFKWYRNAEVCLAYLAGVGVAEDKSSFERSEWFERGWTLQELLAPRTVVFLTNTWQVIGNKGALYHKYSGTSVGPGLEEAIAARTGIPEQILNDFEASQGYTADTKLKWMEGRKTTLGEDMSYALYGIIGVTPGANYGEGYEGARRRLLTAVQQRDNIAELPGFPAVRERRESPPTPSSTVPFPPDPDYVERPALHDQISTKLLSPGARVALVGLGGTGYRLQQ